ncbi:MULTISPECIES: hypothetical protein [Burkholderia]|uniref:hypothetical protein n=1 Tax=Burkholderia TaxID=32008 RepID=UPI001916FE89|nr:MULTISPECIES: hypothetical protein [Burkholderia]
MDTYCITAANHNNPNDNRASEFYVRKKIKNEDGTIVWRRLGKRTLNEVALLLAQGDKVLSGTATKTGEDTYEITPGYPIELELRIAKNDKNFKITDLPTF